MTAAVKSIDVCELRNIAECEGEYDYVENEGPDCVRFDIGERSAWVYASGCMEGDVRMMKQLSRFAKGLVDA
jgi:hypothetical protein